MEKQLNEDSDENHQKVLREIVDPVWTKPSSVKTIPAQHSLGNQDYSTLRKYLSVSIDNTKAKK